MTSKNNLVLMAFVFWTITAAGAFSIGLSVGQRSMLHGAAVSLENVQAELLFNRIEDEQHVGELLRKKCVIAAAEFVDYRTDSDMQQMHSFITGGKLSDALSYIRNRNPGILKEASAYAPRFPNPWQERACN